jgi:hypothetical protein
LKLKIDIKFNGVLWYHILYHELTSRKFFTVSDG